MILLIVGTGWAQDCVPADLDQLAELSAISLSEGNFDKAMELSSDGLAALPCLERVVDPQDLATLWQVQGAVSVYRDGGDGADALRQSHAAYPGWFNERLGAPVRKAWIQAGEGVEATAVLAVWPISDGHLLYVDGQLREEQPVMVAAGEHLIQVAVGAEVAFAQVLTVAGNEQRTIDTGLPEPSPGRPSWVSPWFFAAVGTGLGAGATYVAAYSYVDDLDAAAADGDRPGIDRAWNAQVGLGYIATPVLAAAAVGTGLLWVRQVRREADQDLILPE